MANNYTSTSSLLPIAEEKRDAALSVARAAAQELEDDPGEGACCVDIELYETGLWFSHSESVVIEHLVFVAQKVMDALEIDDPFVFTWAHTCDKRRIDEFSGGACVVRRNKPAVWFIPESDAREMLRSEGEE